MAEVLVRLGILLFRKDNAHEIIINRNNILFVHWERLI